MVTTRRLPAPLLYALALIAPILLIYRPTLGYGFVWDDNLYVVTNPAVQSWSHLPAAFTSPATTWSSDLHHTLPEYRPLRNASYLLDHTLYRLNPTGWHLTNILLHAVTAVLVMLLLLRLLRLLDLSSGQPLPPYSMAVAFLAALLWALHPVQTEIAAWVKSRDDLLATPLLLLALLTALRPRPRPLTILASALLLTAALLSKENALVAIALLPWLAFSLSGRAALDRPLIATTALWALIGLIFLIARHHFLGRTAQAPYPADSPLTTALTMLAATTRYARLILWPFPPTILSADYDAFPLHTRLTPPVLNGLVLILALPVIALATRRRAPLVTAGLGFFAIAMAPYANAIPMMQILAERFLYLPTIGLAIALLGLVLTAPPRLRRPVILLSLLLATALATQTLLRLPVWRSNRTLYEANYQANPTSWRPIDNLIKAALTDGDTTYAYHLSRRALARFPNDPDILRTVALAHLLSGHVSTGEALTSRVINLQPEDHRASQTLAWWRVMQTAR